MNYIEDAAYQIVLNSKLRQKILTVYNEFPEYYDKYKTNTKEIKRMYSNTFSDFSKVCSVLAAAEKDKSTADRIVTLIIKHLVSLSIQHLQGKKSLSFDECSKELIFYLTSVIYYEYHYIYVYINNFEVPADLHKLPGTEKRIVTIIAKSIMLTTGSATFDEQCKSYAKETKIASAKWDIKKEDKENWFYIYKCAVEMFSSNKQSSGAWKGFIKINKTIEEARDLYLKSFENDDFEEKEITLPDSITADFAKPIYQKKDREFDIQRIFTHEIVLNNIQKMSLGIDSSMIMIKESLTEKEVKAIIYCIKESIKTTKNKEPSTINEWAAVIHAVVARCFEHLLIKNYTKSLSNNLVSVKENKKSKSNNKVMLLKLKEENEKLLAKNAKHDVQIKQVENKYKEERKALLNEIHELKTKIKKYEETAKKEKNNEKVNEETKNTFETIMTDEYSEEDFRKFISSNRILVWGLRESTEKKIKQKYPDLSFADSDKKATSQQIKCYDAVIINSNYTSHSKYYSFRDTVKAADVPFEVLDNGSNNDYWLFKAAEKLGEKLKEKRLEN